MRLAIYRLIVFALALGFSAMVWPRDLSGQWDLKIEDKNRHVVTVLVIEFTNQQARSCIGGNWLRVNVVSATTENTSFFPASDALSYSIENNQLTIANNEISDLYIELRGTLVDEAIRGEYFGYGWGSSKQPLGFFELSRRR